MVCSFHAQDCALEHEPSRELETNLTVAELHNRTCDHPPFTERTVTAFPELSRPAMVLEVLGPVRRLAVPLAHSTRDDGADVGSRVVAAAAVVVKAVVVVVVVLAKGTEEHMQPCGGGGFGQLTNRQELDE